MRSRFTLIFLCIVGLAGGCSSHGSSANGTPCDKLTDRLNGQVCSPDVHRCMVPEPMGQDPSIGIDMGVLTDPGVMVSYIRAATLVELM